MLYKLLLLLVVNLAFYASFPIPSAQAAFSAKQRALLDSGVYYYDYESCQYVASTATRSNAVDAKDVEKNAQIIYGYLTGKGLTKPQAGGVLANLYSESSLNPRRVQGVGVIEADEITVNGSTGYGLAQWTTKNRQQGLKDAADKAGKPSSDLGVQLDYLWYELTHGYRGALTNLRKTDDYRSATDVILNQFEAPKVRNLDERVANFQAYYDKLQDTGATTTLPSIPTAAEGECSCSAESQGGSVGKVDIKEAVSKNKLHSAAVMEVGGEVIAAENADDSPNTPASTMKLIIVDTVLRSGIDLDKKITVSDDVLYDGNNDLKVSSISVKDAITKTLSRSSNVGANVLVKALGGPDDFTAKAQGYGYKNTDMKLYYSSAAQGKNKSTIGDQVTAMSHIFSENGEGYKVAQTASKNAANDDNHYGVEGPVANKWAGTSTVAGNVALFEINGTQYVIGLYFDNAQPAAPSDNAIKRGTADIKALLEKSAGGGSPGDCGTVGGEGADAIAEWAIKMSWPESRGLEPKPEYKEAVKKYNPSRISMLADCGTFVSTAVLASGADKEFPPGYTPTMEDHVRANTGKWDVVNKVDKITDLRPGDVMIVNKGGGAGASGHTFVFVGKQDPKGYDAASASLNQRTGNLGPAVLSDDRGFYLRARIK